MAGSITVELKGLRFFALCGVYAEEEKIENEVEVNMQLQYKAPDEVITELEETVDYTAAYAIVRDGLKEQNRLLETAVMKICDQLYEKFNHIEKISLSVKKLTPPITNFTGSVGVTYTRVFQ